MANQHKGEAEVEIGGKTYTFCFTVNALCEAEAQSRLPIHLVGEQLQRGYLSAMRLLIWAGLRHHHGEMTMDEAGDLASSMIKELGAEKAGQVIASAFAAAFPEPEPNGDPAKKAAAGSGPSS